jgi:hypothetical protein
MASLTQVFASSGAVIADPWNFQWPFEALDVSFALQFIARFFFFLLYFFFSTQDQNRRSHRNRTQHKDTDNDARY